MRYKNILILTLILQFTYSQICMSHPHVFFESDFEVKIEKDELEGIEVHLILDRMNTMLNRRILKPNKENNIESENIVFLEELYKHIRVSYDKKNISKNDIIFEEAKLDEGQLEIYLFIPIYEKVKKDSKLKLAFYDKKYYYNYDYGLSSLKVDEFGKKFDRKKIKFYTNKKISFYFNLVNPEEYEVVF